MRDKHYKLYCYRLDDKTNEQIKILSKKHNLSKNLLFLGLINLGKKYGLPEMQKSNGKKKAQRDNTKNV